MPKKMYVIQADDGMFYCGMRYWDKQLRKAKIYHSLSFAEDVVKSYDECNCKIIEVSLAIVSETKTNADRVRSMSDEELAKFLDMCESRGYEDSSIATDSGGYCMDMLEWLQQPAEDDQRRTERRC